jgi:hypothetical protein
VPNVVGRAALFAGIALLIGCGGAGSPGARDAGAAEHHYVDPRADVCADPGAATPPFALIQRIFTENCTSCHTDGVPRVNLQPGVSWSGLVQQPAPAPESCGGVLVVPGQPSASYLIQKLTSATPCYGEQMPLSDFGSDPLPSCVVAIVQGWIAEGAPGPAADGGATD